MTLEKPEALLERLEKNIPIYGELAPLDKDGKPQWGIRRYPESLTDSEWKQVVDALKGIRRLEALEEAMREAEQRRDPWLEVIRARAAEIEKERSK